MSYQPVLPTARQGFMPLPDSKSTQTFRTIEMNTDEIPMTQVRSHASSATYKRQDNESMYGKEGPSDIPPPTHAGRRKLKKVHSRHNGGDQNGDMALTGMGKFYDKIVNFSVVTRYLVYVLPVAALIAIPLVVGATVAPEAKIGGMRILWFFTWIECVWLSIWIAKLFAKLLPWIFVFLCGVVSPGTRKYALILRRLEIPLSLVGWAIASIATFQALLSRPDNSPEHWTDIMKKILAVCLIAACIFLAEKLIIQLISISYHQRSFNLRIMDSKRHIHLLCLLFDASRALFPMFCPEFAHEDYQISGSIDAIANNLKKNGGRPGTVTPMRLLGNVGRFGDKLTSAFGNVAHEITGKQVFNPNSSHSIVVEALEKKKKSEALARRMWMSLVIEGKDSLSLEDIQEVLGPARAEEAEEAFASIDVDNNGDISLDEMIMKVVEISRERKAIANSMHDIGDAISVLDSVLQTIAFIIIVFVFVAFLNASFVTTLATAGTTLLSLSFVFAVTCQEFLGSCIFLFIKHPYDVGDRVDIQGPEKEQLVVDQISLLYTVFKRIDCMRMVQIPNIVLNTMWVENVTRSKAMKEQLELSISFDTSLEDIELLRAELEAFVRQPDNARDFQPDIVLECSGIGTMDKLLLKVEIRHKSNWSNETVRAARRSKFMCALVLALRKVPIYGPGGGGTALGDPLNPSYSVTVTDAIAAAGRDKAAADKEAARLVPSAKPAEQAEDAKADGGRSTGVETGVLGGGAEVAAAMAMNARRPAEDAGRDNTTGATATVATAEQRADSPNAARNHEIETLKQDLVKRSSTTGRRRPGVAGAPLEMGMSGAAIGLTPASPHQLRAPDGRRGDEEEGLGLYGPYGEEQGQGYGQQGQGFGQQQYGPAQQQQQQQYPPQYPQHQQTQQVPGGSYMTYPTGQPGASSASPPPGGPPRKDEFRRL